jgi:light-regulated signal transduction histidine kinase (bacteriophytochrome)
MRAHDDVLRGLLACGDELCSVFGASGIAVHSGDLIDVAGQAPPEHALALLAEHVDARDRDGVFVCDSIAAELPQFERFSDVASGVLSFALPGPLRRRLFAFRPEIVQVVEWAGEPNKAIEPGEPLQLRPRHSFALWREQLRLHSADFAAGEIEAALDLRRLAVEVDLVKQVEREQRAVRLRDDLVAVVSHDLKNPLGVIHMQAALLRRVSEAGARSDSPRVRASVESIARAVDRMNALVNDLLDLSRIEAGRFELQCQREPIEEMVGEALTVLRPLAEAKRIALIEQIEHDAVVWADRERFFQLLSNLVGNAIKFTPEGGRVLMRAAVEGRRLHLAVEDSGPGIAPDQAGQVFNRYWHEPKGGKAGTGLGLYIAKGIVEAHGGEIWLERSNEGGAAFRIALPLA